METNIPKEEKDNLEQVRETPTVKNTELTNYPDECFCPSCGKFVGAYERCPMCQASMKTRMELKLVKRIAVFGAIIGVLLLWFASARKEIPIVKIEDIKINNNLAIITVRGTVININVNDTAKNFSITLDDETDTIKIINAGKLDEFRNIFREKFPKPGDLIEVTGNVSISEKWGASMFLSSTRRMKVLKRLEIEELKLAEISEKNLNQTLMIKNVEIIKTNKYTIGQNITLKDESGELPLNVFDSDLAKIQDIGVKQALTSKGSKITFKGVVKQYKGNLQLALASPSDSSSIIINSAGKNEKGIEKTVILSPIGEINENFLNKTVTIEGVVEKIINTTAGRILTLKEEDSSITVWIPSKMPLTNEIKESSKLQIKGKVTSYRDNIQVVPFGTDCVINL